MVNRTTSIRAGKLAVLGLLGAFACVPACGGTGTSGFFGDGGGGRNGGGGDGAPGSQGSGTGSGGHDSGVVLGGGPGADASSGGPTDCPPSAKLVYVTGQGSKLYSFYPPTLKFTLIGTLTCLSSPTHMTVDRQGAAWVVSGGNIYKASTLDASCAAVPTWAPHPQDFSDFALTFLGTTNAPDTTLYMLGSSAFGQAVLGTFNTATGAVTHVGMPNVLSPAGDMTTNGDGTLYFLMDQPQLALYELSPAGQVLKTLAPQATGGGDQALAFYGGSFYAFENGTIYQFDPMTHATKSVGTAPLLVTGAGQSTCVPIVAPPPSK